MLDLEGQAVRNVHIRAIGPELIVRALVQLVMQDQEIADPFELGHRDAVIFVNDHWVETTNLETRPVILKSRPGSNAGLSIPTAP